MCIWADVLHQMSRTHKELDEQIQKHIYNSQLAIIWFGHFILFLHRIKDSLQMTINPETAEVSLILFTK